MGDKSTSRTPAARTARVVLFLSALLLPSLSLLPLGGLYLWEKGWLLWWALAALLVIAAVVALQARLLAAPENSSSGKPSGNHGPYYSPAEKSAWNAVRRIADETDIDKLDSSQALFDLGHRTVNAVAARMHPGKSDALWQFTVPEAMAIVERVSARMGGAVLHHVPFGDRLTVSQMLAVYRWRHLADSAERAYDIWRVVRLANPATAATHEARERLSRALLSKGREHFSRRLVQDYVEEVGRAAIDLYSGRLRMAQKTGDGHWAAAGTDRSPPAGAIDALVVGAWGDLSTSVARGLAELEKQYARRLSANESEFRGRPLIAAAFSTCQTGSDADDEAIVDQALATDAIVWVLGPDEADIALAGRMLSAIATAYRSRTDVLPPPLVIVADRTASPRLDEPLRELGCIYGADSTAPVFIEGLTSNAPALAEVWSALLQAAPLALRAQALRRLAELKRSDGWISTAKQAAGATARMARWLAARRPRSDQPS